MELHGGSVSVLSDGEGTGCTFTMDIPLVPMAAGIIGRNMIHPENLCGNDNTAEIHCSEVINTWKSYDYYDDEDISSLDLNSEHDAYAIRHKALKNDYNAFELGYIQDIYLATSSLSVLIVDDSGPNRKMLSRLISSSFGKVSLAVDGLDALRFVRETHQKPEIILMDYVMPNMDGPTATKELRALGYKGMIIGVTGNALPAEIDTFLDHGATCVLTKPLRLKELFAAISGTFI